MNGSCPAPELRPSRRRSRHAAGRRNGLALALLGLALLGLWPALLPAVELTGSLRDAFPVFDEPAVLTVAEAEARGDLHPRDAVLGIALGGEARAYPIAVMGIHELGNDTLGGVPIAVSW